MDDDSTIEALTQRVAQLEALVERLAATDDRPIAAPEPPTGAEFVAAPIDTTPLGDRTVDRRKMLGRAGFAAVGAVLGSTAAAVAVAGPAAAANGTFDQVEITGSQSPALRIAPTGPNPRPSVGAQIDGANVGVVGSGAQWGVFGASDINGDTVGVGVYGHGGRGYGVMATGSKANILLKADPTGSLPAMVPPRTRTDAHERGELYFDSNSELWLCIANGTPGTWARLGGPGTSGMFDSNTSTPAITASNTSSSGGKGIAVTTNGGTGLTIDSPGPSPAMVITSGTGIVALDVEGDENSVGTFSVAKNFGVIARATGPTGMGLSGEAPMFGVAGKGTGSGTGTGVGVVGYSPESIGMWAWGKASSILLGPGHGLGENPDEETPSPRSSTIAHERGELAFDADSDLWLCTADGTPGTWVRLAGPGSAGAFSVLHAPARVYDTRTGSGYPGAGTGPVTGIRRDIDLTAANSTVPTDATAAVIILSATHTTTTSNGRATVFANDLPTAPTFNFLRWTGPNQTLAASTTTAVTAGKIAARVEPQANLIVDVIGYFR